MKNVSLIWKTVADSLKTKTGEAAFEAWLKPIAATFDASQDALVLEVPNEFFRDWVMQHYDPAIRDILKVSGHDLAVTYRVNANLMPETEAAKKTPPRPAVKETWSDQFCLNPKYTFDNFIVGPSNRFTHAACLSIAESPAKAYNPLFIYGGVGLGKTHLMQAICHKIRQNNPRSRFFYTSSEKFMNDLIAAIQHRSTQAFRDKFRHVDVLLIDDIHFIAGREATQEEFFHTFNALYDSHKQIILASDRPPKEIQKLEERLVSRFSWGLVADIQPPDLETRIAILKKKIENETTAIPDDAIHFIAETIKTNIRELEGALVRVIASSLLEDKKVTLHMVQTVLKDLLRESARQISLDDIIRAASEYFKTSAQDIKSKKRARNIVLPRQVAMFCTRELTHLSLPEIGSGFGGRDHTTVLHAVKKIKEDIHMDPQIENAVDAILGSFKK
jgi:chromosomal replication initiator protein